MAKKYVQNNGDSPQWVGGLMIMPGEGREVDVADEAAPEPEPEAEPDPDDALVDLLTGTVAQVAAAVVGLGAESLRRLRELEAAAVKPRKGVLEAIDVAAIAAADAALALKSDPL
jgi:hypothetical protein